MALEVPLEGNGKSLCSLRIRISDAVKWLADRFRPGDLAKEPYARLKGRLRYKAADQHSTSKSTSPSLSRPSITLTQHFKLA
jgi:hypothetical protein